MHHEVHAVHGHVQAFGIPYVTDEIAHAGVIETLLHLELLEFITGVDDQPARRVERERTASMNFLPKEPVPR